MNWNREHKRALGAKLAAIKPFDPYHSPLCTCPPKLTLNVYTGCGTECVYCYTSSYAYGRWGRSAGTWGPRVDVVRKVERDIERIAREPALAELRGLPVVLSLSSDPYPNSPGIAESELGLTRRCLELLAGAGFPLLVQTKSDLVVRDLDVLPVGRSVVGMTITTADKTVAARLEPYCPPPDRRLAALAEAAKRGHRTVCRIDPLVPGVNDAERPVAELVAMLADVGVNHVVSSTFKARADSAARLAREFPEAAADAEPLWADRVAGYRYLHEHERSRRMEMVRSLTERAGMSFSCCREGLPGLNAESCDGQHLLRRPEPDGAPDRNGGNTRRENEETT